MATRILKRLFFAVLFSILVVSLVFAQSIPQASSPEEVGLSKERLQRISTWLQNDVEKKSFQGQL